MKQLMLFGLCALMATAGFSQSKVGSIDIDLILSKMPEMTIVQDSLKAYGNRLDKDLNAQMAEYQSQLDDYNKAFEANQMSQSEMQTKQQEIFKLEDDINRFRQNGIKLMQLREDDLKRPLYQKIATALEKVAQENRFTQVLSYDSGLVYVDPDYDITQTVMHEMGIKE